MFDAARTPRHQIRRPSYLASPAGAVRGAATVEHPEKLAYSVGAEQYTPRLGDSWTLIRTSQTLRHLLPVFFFVSSFSRVSRLPHNGQNNHAVVGRQGHSLGGGEGQTRLCYLRSNTSSPPRRNRAYICGEQG